jgi:hypothetical protein
MRGAGETPLRFIAIPLAPALSPQA